MCEGKLQNAHTQSPIPYLPGQEATRNDSKGHI